jgi:CyaY protein
MNESEFNRRASETLLRIEEAVEASGADIDYESAGEVLTLVFANGSRIVVNKQAAAHQIWVAARSGGFHYGFDAGRGAWLNDRSGEELFGELSRLASEQAGEPLTLS